MPKRTDRRTFLNKAMMGAAGAGAIHSLEENILLAALSGEAEEAADEPGSTDSEPMPCGRIGKLKISRMFLGGNLIGGWAHSRDLIYVSELFKAYNTDQKVAETLEMAEARGVNMVLIDPPCQDVVEKYKRSRGGKIQTMVCMKPVDDPTKMREEIRRVIDQGATTVYTHGEATDRQVMAERVDVLGAAVDLIKAEGLPAGIGSHSLETPIAAEKANLGVDYYVKTFHDDRYWSASPKENRQEWCWYSPRTGEHGDYNDNIFCLDSERTAAFMEKVEKPWVAFKVLAAGAIRPRVGFAYAFRHGADFICVGMFDFHVDENVKLAKDLLARIKDRARPWRA